MHAIDPQQPVLEIQTLERIVEESLGQRPTAMRLLVVFAGWRWRWRRSGIYSVLAYTVRQRVREIGIRMALGAPSSGVLRLVVVEGLKPTLAGVVLGLLLAAALVRLMATLLFGVSPYDPGTFTIVAGLVLLVGVVATLDPGVPGHARRPDRDPAGRVDCTGRSAPVAGSRPNRERSYG